LNKNELLQFTKFIGLPQFIVGVALRKRKQKGNSLAGIMGRNNPTFVNNKLWAGEDAVLAVIRISWEIIGHFRHSTNRCFHGIIHPLKNGLDVGISFWG